MRLRKLVALVLTVCACASLMAPMASAADKTDKYEGAAVPIKLTVAANERSNGSYNVSYTASLTLSEDDATAFAVLLAGKSTDQLEKVTFVCVLGDDMIRKQTLSAEQLANFSITDSKKYFEQVGSAVQDSKIGNNVVLTYKLNSATTAAWNLATAETLKSALSGQTVEVKQSAVENVASSAVAGTITTDSFVDVYYNGVLYNTQSHAAYGTTTMTKKRYSSGGSGSSSSSGSSSGTSSGSSSPVVTGTISIVETDVASGDVTSTQSGVVNGNLGGTVTVAVADGSSTVKAGVKMRLNVKANPGKTITGVIVSNKDVARLPVEYKGDGVYEFVQPEGDLIVNVQYKSSAYLPDDSGVNSLLITDSHVSYTIGDDEGNWRPFARVTRAEAAMMLYRLLRNPNTGATISFSDVSNTMWYADAIKSIASLGVIKGYEDGTFRPDAAITRAEFTAICTRFVKDGVVNGNREFADVPLSFWAHNEIAKAEALGWVVGLPNGTFRPSAPLARVEAVTILNRMLGRPGDDAAIKAGKGTAFPDVPKDFWGYNAIIESTTPHSFTVDRDTYTESWSNING